MLGSYEDDRNFTQDEIEAVAEAFIQAQTPRQQVITSVLALLCCVPARISEILELPVDCDVVLDPGDGHQSGLRWWPKKGGAPQIKFVPKAMVPVAKEALLRIKHHTDSARRLAHIAMDAHPLIETLPEGCRAPDARDDARARPCRSAAEISGTPWPRGGRGNSDQLLRWIA